MAYALLSDIHGDVQALESVLAELATLRVEDGVVLGDVAQGGDEPAAVLDRLAELGWPVILGNADAWLLDASVEEAGDAARRRREWTVGRLDERHLDQIRSFRPTYERDALLAFHGSPRSFHDVLEPDTDDVSPWSADGPRLLAGGHTHHQWVRRLGDALYVNPGAVMSSPPEFAVVHGDGVEFRRVG